MAVYKGGNKIGKTTSIGKSHLTRIRNKNKKRLVGHKMYRGQGK